MTYNSMSSFRLAACKPSQTAKESMQSLPGDCQVGTESHACASSLKLAKSKVMQGRPIHFGNETQQGLYLDVWAALEGIIRLPTGRYHQGGRRPMAMFCCTRGNVV